MNCSYSTAATIPGCLDPLRSAAGPLRLWACQRSHQAHRRWFPKSRGSLSLGSFKHAGTQPVLRRPILVAVGLTRLRVLNHAISKGPQHNPWWTDEAMGTEDNTTLLKVSRYYTDEHNHAMGAEPDKPVCQAQLAGTNKDLGSQINMQRKQQLDFSRLSGRIL